MALPRRGCLLGALSRVARLTRGLRRVLVARFLQARLERRHEINHLGLGSLVASRLFDIEGMSFFIAYFLLNAPPKIRSVGILKLTRGEITFHALNQLLRHCQFC